MDGACTLVVTNTQALKLWPRNGELVAMLTAAGEAARGAARLRGDLAAACAAGPAPVAWLLALRCEAVRPGAGVHLQPLFERVVGSREGGTCPLMWRCYLAYELGRNRPQVQWSIKCCVLNEEYNRPYENKLEPTPKTPKRW